HGHLLRIDDQNHRCRADDRDRREVAGHVEGQRLEDAREDHDVVGHDGQRAAVGGRACERLQADDTAGAGLVVDHHRCAEGLRQRGLRSARDGVDAGACRIGQDEFHDVGVGECGGRAEDGKRGKRKVAAFHGMGVFLVIEMLGKRQPTTPLARSWSMRSSLMPSAVSNSRLCSPASGGSSRTPRRAPAMVKGSSVVLTVSPAFGPSGTLTSARPPVASRCSSSYRSSGLRMGAKGKPAFSMIAAISAALRCASRSCRALMRRGRSCTRWLLVASSGSAFRSARPRASQNVFHCASLTAARKICSPSFTVNTSYTAQGLLRAGMGAGCSPVTAYCRMCCPTRNTLFSYRADCTSMPRPVMPRCTSAPSTPMAPNRPPIMSLMLVPARIGSPGRPVMYARPPIICTTSSSAVRCSYG